MLFRAPNNGNASFDKFHTNAARRVLDVQLGQLIEHGLINKVVFDQLPLKVEYELTGLGESLIPVIAVTAQWGEDHRNELEKIL